MISKTAQSMQQRFKVCASSKSHKLTRDFIMSNDISVFNDFADAFFENADDNLSLGGSLLCQMLNIEHKLGDEAGISDNCEKYAMFFRRGNIAYLFADSENMFANCRSDSLFSIAKLTLDASWELFDEATPEFVEKFGVDSFDAIKSWFATNID
jgi:hypothetical protein